MRLFLLSLFLIFDVCAIEITEETLLNLAMKDVPQLDQIQARLLQSELAYKESLDNFKSSAYTAYNHNTTREKAVIPFIPIYSPVNQYQAGVVAPTQYGVSADLSASVDQRSGTSSQQSFSNIHTTIYALTLNLDLWKDLFGKLTRKRLENARISFKSAQLQKEIEKRSFMVAVRRLYWSLVANKEKRKISQNLLEASMAQTKDAKKRLEANVADVGEVARYQAQVAQRRGSLLFLRYEQEAILKRLKDLVPKLNATGNISLGNYDLDATLGEVLQCAGVIQRKKEVPLAFTRYDEVASLLKVVQRNQKAIDGAYDDVDLRLATTFKQTGIGSEQVNGDYEGSLQKSFDDIEDQDRSGFEASLRLTIPIGKKTGDTEKVLKEYNKKRLKAEISNTFNNIISTHERISQSVKILQEVIQAQKLNSEQLKIRVNDMRKKYNQARISVNDLIQDQDALFSSDLAIVDTKLSVLNTLLDYFSVFTETPCSFNRI